MIRFAKIFVEPKEGQMYKPCLCAYIKAPWVMETNTNGDGVRIERIIQYKHYLYINLWLIELDFDWLTPKSLTNN